MKRTVINLINSPKTEMTLGGSWEMDLCTGCCVKHPICQTGKIAKIKKVKKDLEKQCLCGHGHKLTSRKDGEATNHQSFVWPTMV